MRSSCSPQPTRMSPGSLRPHIQRHGDPGSRKGIPTPDSSVKSSSAKRTRGFAIKQGAPRTIGGRRFLAEARRPTPPPSKATKMPIPGFGLAACSSWPSSLQSTTGARKMIRKMTPEASRILILQPGSLAGSKRASTTLGRLPDLYPFPIDRLTYVSPESPSGLSTCLRQHHRKHPMSTT